MSSISPPALTAARGFVQMWRQHGVLRRAVAALALAPALALGAAGVAQRWIHEDAFINLRVVRNVLAGSGPVFNLDERVEAATSPLWVAVLVALGRLGVRLEYAAVAGGIALTVAGVLLAQQGALRLRRAHAGSFASEPRHWLPVPVGAAIFAALPPAWDYASSGLENGLAIGWLGASFFVLARRIDRAAPAARPAVDGAVLLGLGPLIRPEFAVYAAAFLVPLAWATARALPGRKRALRLVGVALSAGAAPVAYELFRMGYYGGTVPNTALAKEAFLANWGQGSCYFLNFFGTYAMGWPLAAAGIVWGVGLAHSFAGGSGPSLAAAIGPPFAASVHVFYLVAIGGDYMHARLLLPAVFAALLPVMAVPLVAPRWWARAALGAAGVVLAVWLPFCVARLRVGAENVCNIGDERAWYAREAKESNPVEVGSYRQHFFYASAMRWLKQMNDDCADTTRAGGCRLAYLDEEKPKIAPAPTSSPLARDVDSRVRAAVHVGAIGIVGYVLPASTHVVDFNGLSDPIVGRFALDGARGRPGHEKTLSGAWMLARFAEPSPEDDGGVTAARHALQCGTLGALMRAVRAPLTLGLFLDNVAHASAYSRLRIPRDPYEAEQRFCGTPAPAERAAGGGGGSAFRWLCPRGHFVSAVRASYKPGEKAIARVQALCERSAGSGAPDPFIGPWFGEEADASFEIACPPEDRVVGFYGRADEMVRSVGLLCRASGRVVGTNVSGVEGGGEPFQVTCPGQGGVVGIKGRAGSLVDSVGVVCGQ